MWFKVRLP